MCNGQVRVRFSSEERAERRKTPPREPTPPTQFENPPLVEGTEGFCSFFWVSLGKTGYLFWILASVLNDFVKYYLYFGCKGPPRPVVLPDSSQTDVKNETVARVGMETVGCFKEVSTVF